MLIIACYYEPVRAIKTNLTYYNYKLIRSISRDNTIPIYSAAVFGRDILSRMAAPYSLRLRMIVVASAVSALVPHLNAGLEGRALSPLPYCRNFKGLVKVEAEPKNEM